MKNIKPYIDKQINLTLLKIKIDDINLIVNVHKELFNGSPLQKSKYYELIGTSNEKADSLLELVGELNENEEITAFFGLSLMPTQHKLIIGNKTLYTWCALDAILFSEWLDETSQVFSYDPIDNSLIELNIVGDHLISSEPYPIYISWLGSIDVCNIKSSFCNHVAFFASEQTAKKWLTNNPNGKIFSLDDIFEYDKIGLICC